MQKRSHYLQISLPAYPQINVKFCLASSLALCYWGWGGEVRSQITPDGTLSTNITTTDNLNFTINEGNRAGNNLFHSFREFSVPTGGEAFFNNAVDIQNIFSRVTGNSISNIDGLIRANGIANLFLINPNGIIFGQNARLNIGGSFLGSTASSIKFGDGIEFSASNPQSSPLLSINVPIGLQFNSSPGQIFNRSFAVGIDPNTGALIPVGLQVQPGKTLALLGGDVRIENGFLTSPSGRIELGSVRGGFVSLTPDISGFALGYQDIPVYGDIQLSGQSTVDASGFRGGDIQVQGRRVTLTDTAKIASSTFGPLPGGNLTLNASESVELTGNGGLEQTLIKLVSRQFSLSDLPNGLFVPSLGDGGAGNVMINTRSLIARNGALVLTTTFGPGEGGNLTVNATDNVQVNGSALLTGTTDTGVAGDLTINTTQLIITQGLAGTLSFGTGRSGNMTVNASLVELNGGGKLLAPNFGISNLRAAAGLNTSGVIAGDAGDLTINTDRLIVLDEAGVAASTIGLGQGGTLTVNATESVELSGFETGITVGTNGAGDGGDLRINTGRLIVRNQGGADASSFNSGKGGNLTIKASEFIELIGENGGLGTRSEGSGNAGNLRIETGRLTIRNGALISVGAKSSGDAGNLDIQAETIELLNSGGLVGKTTAGQGNITLRSNSLILRGESSITTDASGKVEGGNITINSNVLAALENSDITANAQEGKGGNITINAQTIFGAVPRTREELQLLLNTKDGNTLDPRRLLTSDVTAISQQGGPQLEGTIALNTPDIDPASGLLNLPDNVVDATTIVASVCRPRGGEQNQFIFTGRGGLPPNPIDGIPDKATWFDLRPRLVSQTEKASEIPITNSQLPITNSQIIEAQGWVTNAKGEVVLTAQASTATPANSGLAQQECYAP